MPAPKDGEHIVAFTLDDDPLAMIERLCAADERNRSQMMRVLVKAEAQRRGLFSPPRALQG